MDCTERFVPHEGTYHRRMARGRIAAGVASLFWPRRRCKNFLRTPRRHRMARWIRLGACLGAARLYWNMRQDRPTTPSRHSPSARAWRRDRTGAKALARSPGPPTSAFGVARRADPYGTQATSGAAAPGMNADALTPGSSCDRDRHIENFACALRCLDHPVEQADREPPWPQPATAPLLHPEIARVRQSVRRPT